MIGISSKAGDRDFSTWFEPLVKADFKLIELNRRVTSVEFNAREVERMKQLMKTHNLTLTIHSGVTDLLYSDPIIAAYQLNQLKAEIDYASKLQIKFVAFHLSKFVDHKKDSQKISEFFSDILLFASKRNVQLVLENDSNGPWSTPDQFLPYFEKYSSLKHLLDIGHLNRSVRMGLVKSEKDYLDKLGKYIVYVHAHGNDGTTDAHKSINFGNVRKDEILPTLKIINPEIIILETLTIKDALDTKQELEKYGFEG